MTSGIGHEHCFSLRFKGRFRVTMFPQGSQKLFLVRDGMLSPGGDLETGSKVMSRKPRSKDCLSSMGQCLPLGGLAAVSLN